MIFSKQKQRLSAFLGDPARAPLAADHHVASRIPESPKVSVIVPTHDGRLPFLKQAVASVRAQSYRDWELVVVDAASRDGTARWLASQKIPALRRVRLARNPGPVAAYNAGIRASRGELCAFLDSDDFWKPSYLRIMAPLFERRPELQVACSWCEIEDVGSSKPRYKWAPRWNRVFSGLTGMPRPMSFSMTVVRRSAFSRTGFLDPSFRWVSFDVDFMYRAALAWGTRAFVYVRRALAVYRRHPNQTTHWLQMSGHDIGKVGEWASLDPRQRESLVDMACFYHRYEAVIGRYAADRSAF